MRLLRIFCLTLTLLNLSQQAMAQDFLQVWADRLGGTHSSQQYPSLTETAGTDISAQASSDSAISERGNLLSQDGEIISFAEIWRHYWLLILLLVGIGVALCVVTVYALMLNKRLRESGTALQQEMSDRKKADDALLQERKKAMVTLSSISNAVISTDAAGYVEYLNPVAERLMGWETEQARGKVLMDLVSLYEEDAQTPISNMVDHCLAQKKLIRSGKGTILINRDNVEYGVEMTSSPMNDDRGRLIGAVVVIQDISEMRRMEQQITYQATHDDLTGLINRREFEVCLKSALEQAKAHFAEHALLYLDLDQFKLVNDTCGHIAGDELLIQITTELQSVIDRKDKLGRLGGDEFAVLLEDCDLDNASQVAERLRNVIEEFRFVWQDKVFDLGVSIGVVSVTHECESVIEILSAADTACYAAKDGGRNRVFVYSLEDKIIARRYGEMQWLQEVKRALKEDRFRIDCQKIVSISSDEQRAKWEVLLRMIDEDGKVVAPMAFIPAAERYHQMPAIDRWVTERAIKTLSEYGITRPDQFCCFVNLSGQTLSDSDFLHYVIERFDQYKVDPACLCFEITETSAIANFQKARRLISVLRNIGCRFALDDFGTGLSSFAYLKQLPVDFIKIDGSFVRNLADDEVACSIVEAIGRIGHTMGIQSIAEFVEDDTILEKLTTLGVDYAQGFGIHRCVPFETVLDELTADNTIVPFRQSVTEKVK